MRYLFIMIVLLCICTRSVQQTVSSIRVEASINPATASFIKRSIERAAANKSECLIIHLNTPGGLLKSTRQIVSDIFGAPVPVVIYVSPSGSHAASAGVFVTMAAHVAVMAPGTNIGAAHPVSMGGGMDTIMNEKSTNDAVAFIRSIAGKRKRNISWAEEAVRKSVSITEREALDKGIIDTIAADEVELLQILHGRAVTMSSGERTMRTADASVTAIPMTAVEKFLNMISDPNIAYLLMMLGFYGLLFELYSPGAIFPGVLGGISLILAFYALHTMPLNYAGLAFILFGIVLLLLEIKVTSYGMLAIGGVVSLFLGSFFLLDQDSSFEMLKISMNIIVAVTIVSALFFLFIGWMGLRAQKSKPVSGKEGLIGYTGTTLSVLDPQGLVQVHGETWAAESLSQTIDKNKKVIVRSMSGLKLFVEPQDEDNLTLKNEM
jgi:membrane-bound serine protease (ClpP class)